MSPRTWTIERTGNGWVVAVDRSVMVAAANPHEHLATFHNLDACLRWLRRQMSEREFLSGKKFE